MLTGGLGVGRPDHDVRVQHAGRHHALAASARGAQCRGSHDAPAEKGMVHVFLHGCVDTWNMIGPQE